MYLDNSHVIDQAIRLLEQVKRFADKDQPIDQPTYVKLAEFLAEVGA